MISRSSLAVLSLLALAIGQHSAAGRLGETEAQSQARYGAPSEALIGADEKPLLEGAKQLAYSYQGWRVRAAFLNGTTARIEYVHIPEAGSPKKITEAELATILEAEKGKFAWREEKARTGYKELNALKTLFEGRKWERADHATATLKADLLLTFETRDVEAYEKKLAKQAGKPGKSAPATTVPKF